MSLSLSSPLLTCPCSGRHRLSTLDGEAEPSPLSLVLPGGKLQLAGKKKRSQEGPLRLTYNSHSALLCFPFFDCTGPRQPPNPNLPLFAPQLGMASLSALKRLGRKKRLEREASVTKEKEEEKEKVEEARRKETKKAREKLDKNLSRSGKILISTMD